MSAHEVPEFIHETVLLTETVASVLGVATLSNEMNKSGVFVDATFGRGGHSRLLLQYLAEDARLIVFDKDPQAIEVAENLADKDSRVTVVHDSFATLTDSLNQIGITQLLLH